MSKIADALSNKPNPTAILQITSNLGKNSTVFEKMKKNRKQVSAERKLFQKVTANPWQARKENLSLNSIF